MTVEDQKRIGSLTKNTRVLLSFGAAAGGFEFAMQLRSDIMKKYKKDSDKNLDFVYLDAESLRADSETTYSWDNNLGINKMANNSWAEFYKGAMEKCDIMVFLISEPWLKSKWCWNEFNWFGEQLTKGAIKPVFIVFPDAQNILKYPTMIKDSTGKEHNLKDIWNKMITKGTVVDIETPPIQGLGNVTVDGKTYSYNYKYTCNEAERANILKNILVHTP